MPKCAIITMGGQAEAQSAGDQQCHQQNHQHCLHAGAPGQYRATEHGGMLGHGMRQQRQQGGATKGSIAWEARKMQW